MVKWTKIAENAGFSPRYGHTSTLIPKINQVITIGGYSYNESTNYVNNDVWMFELNSTKFKQLDNFPMYLYYHAATLNADQTSIYVFGGAGGVSNAENYVQNTLFEYDISSQTTKIITPKNESAPQPLGRYQHGMHYYEDNLYVFFGDIGNDERVDEIWKYDISKMEWAKIAEPEGGAAVHPISAFGSAIDSSSGNVYILGGCDDGCYGVLWVYSITKNTFDFAVDADDYYIGYETLSFDSKEKTLTSIGGYFKSTLNSIWQFSLTKQNLIQIIPSNKNDFLVRDSHQTVFVQETGVAYVFGGLSGDQVTSFNDVWSVNIRETPSNSSNSNTTVIIAVVVSVVGALLFGVLFYFYYRRNTNKDSVIDLESASTTSSTKPFHKGSISMLNTSTNSHTSHNSNFKSRENPLSSRKVPSASYQNSPNSDGKSPYSGLFESELVSSLPVHMHIDWKELHLPEKTLPEKSVIGKGSFGLVIRAVWKSDLFHGVDREVAVKVISKRYIESQGGKFDIMCQQAIAEALVVKEAEQFVLSEGIIKVYGVALGPLPLELADVFEIKEGSQNVGIVMRYESGGDLSTLLHKQDVASAKLTTTMKISIINNIACSLAELHSGGIVHGDLKPENILLRSPFSTEIRLADFGLAEMKESMIDSGSTLQETSRTKGTLMYCAPEMLFDVTNTSKTVAKASRKTDVYAFGIVVWEILSQSHPFPSFKSEAELCFKVHSGERPSLDLLPVDTPVGIHQLIQKAWVGNRAERISATECYAITNFNSHFMNSNSFDIFFSHAWKNKPFLSHLFAELVKAGYRVWYDQNEMGHDMKQSMREGIVNSKIVIACVNSLYQSRENCMFELREACNEKKTVISLVLEANPFEWASEELKSYVDFNSTMFVEMSEVAKLGWDSDEGPTKVDLLELKNGLTPLLNLLRNLGCTPALNRSF